MPEPGFSSTTPFTTTTTTSTATSIEPRLAFMGSKEEKAKSVGKVESTPVVSASLPQYNRHVTSTQQPPGGVKSILKPTKSSVGSVAVDVVVANDDVGVVDVVVDNVVVDNVVVAVSSTRAF
jgi:hypothetical protein